VEFLKELLKIMNFTATAIYGSMDQTARKIAINHFRNGGVPILLVTDVAARGIGTYIMH
jgi:ATP-dependent RNA helicase DDX54/DBP10